jgi:hypothetical protein
MKVTTINLFNFTLWNILEWGKIFVQNHPNYTFEELDQAFCKSFWTVNNDKQVYMQLKNLQQ